jgi:epothilone polyketide synthase D
MDAPAYQARLEAAAEVIRQLRARLEDVGEREHRPVAIVGAALRMPGGADTLEGFWSLLRDGTDTTAEFPVSRGDARSIYDPDPDHPGTAYVIRGAFLDEVDGFEPAVFGISPREAVGMDPQQRIALELAWEALESAGYAPTELVGRRVGVYIGVSTTDYVRMRQQLGDPADMDAYQLVGEPSFIAGRISYTFGLRGPSMVIDTTCSSALVAVHQACQALNAGECDMALAGGVNLMLSPYGFLLMSKFRALAADGRCKTFDASADGYARGEGAGIVVLKRLPEAACDTVLAVIRGSAVNHDGRSSGLTVPSPDAQQDVIRRALAQAGVGPRDITYVEAHGTGTSLGDPIELRALDAVLRAGRGAAEPVLVGSVKTNVGHLEPAAGIAGLLKTVLALRHGEIPPHINLSTPNPKVGWGRLRISVPTSLTAWPAGRPRMAAVSSFGASGTNAHLVLQAADKTSDEVPDDSPNLLVLSARTPGSLRELAARYETHLGAGEYPIADVCFSSQVGRARQARGLAVTGRSSDDISETLRGCVRGGANSRLIEVTRGPGARAQGWLFTGQGSQYQAMAGRLRDEPALAAAFGECARVLNTMLPVPVEEMLDSPDIDGTGFAQPTLFAVGYALGRTLMSWGLRPSVMLGHSVGEITAACLAGALELPDAACLVAGRARLMAALPPGGVMAAVNCSEQEARAASTDADVSLGAVNGPSDVVLSGPDAAVRAVTDTLAAAGYRVRFLAVSHAFHSPLMEPMLGSFGDLLRTITVRQPSIPVISDVTGQPWGPDETTAAYWLRHALATVRFHDGIRRMYADGVRTFAEIGPRPVLSALGRAAIDDPDVVWLSPGTGDQEDLLRALGVLHLRGCRVDWEAVHHNRAPRRVPGPAYPWQRERYWFRQLDPSARAGWYPAEELLYEFSWIEVTPPVSAPGVAAVAGERILVIGDGDPAERVASGLRAAGAWCAVAGLDAGSADGWTRVVVLAPDIATGELSAAALTERVLPTEQRVIRLVQRAAPRIVLVTRGAVAAGAGQRVHNPAGATLWGLGRVIALEHPGCWGGAIDLDPDYDADPGLIAGAVLDNGGEDQLALRGGRWLAARLRPAPDLPANASPDLPAGASPPLCRGTVLVTGGLGGIGTEIASWLARVGVGRIVLAGRSASDATISANDGVPIETAKLDVTDVHAVRALVARLAEGPLRLRGVIHAAGVSAPQDLAEVDEPSYRRVWLPKTVGAWNLHEATRDLDLDFFVCMSSIAATWGSAHLASYAAGNNFLGAVACHRRAQGLPALTVDWGPWAVDSGLYADDVMAFLESTGLRQLPPAQCLSLLHQLLLRAPDPHYIVCAVDWHRYKPVMEARVPRPVLADIAISPDEEDGSRDEELLGRLAASDARGALLTEFLRSAVAGVLHADAAAVEPDADVFAFGLDSLMVLEVVTLCRRRLGVTLRPSEFFGRSTLAEWAKHLDDVLRGASPDEDRQERPEEAHEVSGMPEMGVAAIAPRAVLPADIGPVPGQPEPDPDRVLLTGATGFVGAFLLDELLASTRAEVCCLVRCADPAHGLERMRQAVQKYLPWRKDADERVRILPADLAQPRLGLTGEEFTLLADEIGAVYHAGAVVDFVHTFDQLAPANVDGTAEILRLAGRGRPKSVHHVSTYGIWGLPVPGRERINETDDISSAGRLVTGYVQTKWGAEHLAMQARGRGMPVRIFRLGRVLGDSRSGVCLTTHFTCRVIKGCVQLGLAPDLADLEIEMTPVDYVARALVHISRSSQSDGAVFHLINHVKMRFNDLIAFIRRGGWPLEVVDRERWWTALRATIDVDRNELHPAMDIVREFVVGGEEAIDYDVTCAEKALSASGISCPPLDERLLDTYFGYFTRSGYLPVPRKEYPT